MTVWKKERVKYCHQRHLNSVAMVQQASLKLSYRRKSLATLCISWNIGLLLYE